MRRSRSSTALGYSPNCYVDDRLYVGAAHGVLADVRRSSSTSRSSEVGDLAAWLDRPPTKLVAVADPADIPALREALGRRASATGSS